MDPKYPTPELMGTKKKGVSDFDLESVLLSTEVEQTIKRVGINYPEMAIQALIALRDNKAQEIFEQKIQNDAEAMKVWRALMNLLIRNQWAVETWLDDKIDLGEKLLKDKNEIDDVEDLQRREIPIIQAAFMEKPITLSEFLREVKLANIEFEAIPVPERSPEAEKESMDKILKAARDMLKDRDDAQLKADELLKRMQKK